ncbi:MAG: hypothetical protein HY331_15550, partial [Chloroflexi bacterium]|nr:hypothetical protein [Chloroflexota bacterium]
RGETPGYALTPGPSPAHGRGETGERTLTPGPSPAERERGGERSERGEGAPRIRLLARGPVFAEIEIRRTLVLPGRVEQGRRVGIVRCPMVTRVRLWRQIDRVELETELVNRAEDHRLRVLFPAEPASTVLAESPFAVVRRPLQSPKPKLAWREPPCPTQHTGGAVAVGGLVLLTQGLPEYETWETADGTVLALTLLRCVGLISRDDMWTRPGHAGPPLEVPAAQCIGTHRFAYALQLGRPTPAALLRASQEYRTPGHLGDAGTAGRLNGRLTVEGSDLAWAALKPAEDGGGVVLRLYNPDDHEAATGEVLADGEIRRLALDESDQGPGDRRFALPAGRIGTWRIRPGRW